MEYKHSAEFVSPGPRHIHEGTRQKLEIVLELHLLKLGSATRSVSVPGEWPLWKIKKQFIVTISEMIEDVRKLQPPSEEYLWWGFPSVTITSDMLNDKIEMDAHEMGFGGVKKRIIRFLASNMKKLRNN